MRCLGPLHSFHIADHLYAFCSRPDQDICLSILVCDVEDTYCHVGMCGRNFLCACFVSVQHSAPYDRTAHVVLILQQSNKTQ